MLEKIASRIPRSFFTRPTLEVAPELLGKVLVAKSPEGTVAGEITEVEAYLGNQDPASHAYKGQSERTKAMWLEGGHWYVYFIYGVHFCLNIVTENVGTPGAVLIRAVKPIEGFELMKKRRQLSHISGIPKTLADGPGKLTQAFNINRQHYGLDATNSPVLWLEDRGIKVSKIKTSKRIGISKATEVEWRFFS